MLAVAAGEPVEAQGPVGQNFSLSVEERDAGPSQEPPAVPLPAEPRSNLPTAAEAAGASAASTMVIGDGTQQNPPASGDPAFKPASPEPTGVASLLDAPSVLVAEQTPPPLDPSPTEENEEEIVVTAKRRDTPGDPLRSVNEFSYKLTDEVDKAIVGPVAKVYEHVMPKPVRKGMRNFLNNLREPIVFINYLLQLKPGKAVETAGRFAINSTLGLGGVIDVAKRCPFNLPWRPNGFGDTLGVYGVKDGPYIFVPLLGPTTIRDLVGGAVDRVASPIALGGPFKSRTYVVGTNAFRILDTRAEKDDEIEAERNSADPYAARRERYLRDRQTRLDRIRGTETPPETISDEKQDDAVPVDEPAGERGRQPSKSKRGC